MSQEVLVLLSGIELTKYSDFNRLKQTFGDSGIEYRLNSEVVPKIILIVRNISSLDVERSFCAYKNNYSSRRIRLHKEIIETYMMLHIFQRTYPLHLDTKNVAKKDNCFIDS